MKPLAFLVAVAIPATAFAQWPTFQPIMPAPVFQRPIYTAPIIPAPPPIRWYSSFNQSGPGWSSSFGYAPPPQPVIVAPTPTYIQPFQWQW